MIVDVNDLGEGRHFEVTADLCLHAHGDPDRSRFTAPDEDLSHVGAPSDGAEADKRRLLRFVSEKS